MEEEPLPFVIDDRIHDRVKDYLLFIIECALVELDLSGKLLSVVIELLLKKEVILDQSPLLLWMWHPMRQTFS